jgi:hypothetical protein
LELSTLKRYFETDIFNLSIRPKGFITSIVLFSNTVGATCDEPLTPGNSSFASIFGYAPAPDRTLPHVTFFIKGKKPEEAMYILDDWHARLEMIRNAGSTVSVTFLSPAHPHNMNMLKPVGLGDMLDVPRREWPEHLYAEWIKMKPEHIDYLRHSVGKCSRGSKGSQ